MDITYELRDANGVLQLKFTIPLNPVPTLVQPGSGFQYQPVSATNIYPTGGNGADVLSFFLGGGAGGGMGDILWNHTGINLFGDCAFSGTESAPTMLTGTFNMNDGINSYTLKSLTPKVTTLHTSSSVFNDIWTKFNLPTAHAGHTVSAYGDYAIWCETDAVEILPESLVRK